MAEDTTPAQNGSNRLYLIVAVLSVVLVIGGWLILRYEIAEGERDNRIQAAAEGSWISEDGGMLLLRHDGRWLRTHPFTYLSDAGYRWRNEWSISHGRMIVTTYGIDSSFTEAETISVSGNILVTGKLGTYVRLDSDAGRAVWSSLGLPPIKSFR